MEKFCIIFATINEIHKEKMSSWTGFIFMISYSVTRNFNFYKNLLLEPITTNNNKFMTARNHLFSRGIPTPVATNSSLPPRDLSFHFSTSPSAAHSVTMLIMCFYNERKTGNLMYFINKNLKKKLQALKTLHEKYA